MLQVFIWKITQLRCGSAMSFSWKAVATPSSDKTASGIRSQYLATYPSSIFIQEKVHCHRSVSCSVNSSLPWAGQSDCGWYGIQSYIAIIFILCCSKQGKVVAGGKFTEGSWQQNALKLLSSMVLMVWHFKYIEEFLETCFDVWNTTLITSLFFNFVI